MSTTVIAEVLTKIAYRLKGIEEAQENLRTEQHNHVCVQRTMYSLLQDMARDKEEFAALAGVSELLGTSLETETAPVAVEEAGGSVPEEETGSGKVKRAVAKAPFTIPYLRTFERQTSEVDYIGKFTPEYKRLRDPSRVRKVAVYANPRFGFCSVGDMCRVLGEIQFANRGVVSSLGHSLRRINEERNSEDMAVAASTITPTVATRVKVSLMDNVLDAVLEVPAVKVSTVRVRYMRMYISGHDDLPTPEETLELTEEELEEMLEDAEEWLGPEHCDTIR